MWQFLYCFVGRKAKSDPSHVCDRARQTCLNFILIRRPLEKEKKKIQNLIRKSKVRLIFFPGGPEP